MNESVYEDFGRIKHYASNSSGDYWQMLLAPQEAEEYILTFRVGEDQEFGMIEIQYGYPGSG